MDYKIEYRVWNKVTEEYGDEVKEYVCKGRGDLLRCFDLCANNELDILSVNDEPFSPFMGLDRDKKVETITKYLGCYSRGLMGKSEANEYVGKLIREYVATEGV